MINENSIVTDKTYMLHHFYRVCWSAVFAGAFVGVGLGFLLHLYGVAISLSAFSSTENGASVIAIGGALGMLVGVIASMAAAGFVAGYLGRFHYYRIHGGVIYGFITWSLIILLSAIIAGPLMNYVSLYGNSLSRSVTVNTPNINVTENNVSTPIVKNKNNTNQPVAEINPTQLAWGGWLVFLLFFVGAISSCIGATLGMRCKREDPLMTP